MRPIHSIHYSIAFFNSSWRGTLKTTTLILYEESGSITGQRELLRDYISQHPELREYAIRIDDGFSGSTFERPGFQKMIEDVKAGRTDCIIVKDYCGIMGLNQKDLENKAFWLSPFFF